MERLLEEILIELQKANKRSELWIDYMIKMAELHDENFFSVTNEKALPLQFYEAEVVRGDLKKQLSQL